MASTHNNWGAWTNENSFAVQDPEVVREMEEKIVGNEGDQLRYSRQNGNHERAPQSVGVFEGREPGKSDVDQFMVMPVIERIPSTEEPLLPLNSRDVAAFIINKMIGTGIFVSPVTVLLLTKSKGEALGLWVLGFVYVMVSTSIYLEFARRLPHTGGEIVFIDETLPNPRLLAHTIYSFYFIILQNTSRNCMQFGIQVVSAANVPYPKDFEPNNKLIRFIGVVIITFISLLHYFSARVGRAMNQIFAFAKIVLLLIVIFSGIHYAKDHFVKEDWTRDPNPNASSSATAFLYILFSFSGWENATFVSGEIPNNIVLRKGFISAVWIVGILYLLVNLIFLIAVPYEAIAFDVSNNGRKYSEFAVLFFGGGDKATVTWAILIALSACGSILSITYTCAKVKQVIGKANLVPWSRLWGASSPARNNVESTPMGGLLLHWIFAVLLIIVSSAIKKQSESVAFPATLLAYGAGVFGIFISVGFLFLFMKKPHFFLAPRNIPLPASRNGEEWDPESNSNRIKSVIFRTAWGRVAFALFYLAINFYIVIVPLKGPYEDGNGNKLEVQGWWYIVIIGCLFLAAVVYYYATIGLTGVDEPRHPKRSILRIAGVEPRICEAPSHDPKFGFRRTVEITIAEESRKPSYLYWFFGGSNETHIARPSTLINLWSRILGR